MEIVPPPELGLGFIFHKNKIKNPSIKNMYLKQLKIRFLLSFSKQLHVIDGSDTTVRI